jgi:hypothetical protein
MSGTATIGSNGLPRAVIPSFPPFELTSPPERPPSREDFLIAEMERRFGGRAVRVEPGERVAEPELYQAPELTEPEWIGGFRGGVGKLLWRVHGLREKAIRFLNCNKLGRPGVCSNYPHEHKFFVPHGCEVVFCKECADESRRELLIDYWHVVCNAVLDFAGERAEHERLCGLLKDSSGLQRESVECRIGELWARVGRCVREKGWVLARVTFTLRCDGREITPERVKAMNTCVGAVMRRTVGSRKGFGMLFVDEVGFEKRGHLPDAQRVTHGLNLHCHGLYFGPFVDWEQTRKLWMEVTVKKFWGKLWARMRRIIREKVQRGVWTRVEAERRERELWVKLLEKKASRGFFITAVKRFAENPGRAIRWALNHMLKYVSKPPAVTPERLASLIAAFDGARRVHSLGLFYGKKPKREKKDCPCPKCRAMGIVSTVSFEGKAFGNGACIPRLERIDDLLGRGYVPLRDAGRDAVLASGVSREDSWGASP